MSSRSLSLLPAAGADTPPATATPSLLPAVPGGGTADDQAEFSALPLTEQRTIIDLDRAFRAALTAAHGSLGPLLETIARRRGCSAKMIRVRYDAWRTLGWRGLINRRRCKGHTLPQAFTQYWLSLREGHQRRTTVRQAWRTLQMQYRHWLADGGLPSSRHAIPGYHDCPRPLRATGLPAGWAYQSLAAIAKRHAEHTARAQGPKAWSATLPSVLASRVGCQVGQFIFFDDEVVDVYVNFIGNNSAMRPLAFHALDFVSGCNIARGFKPVIQDGNSRRTVASQLTKADFEFFLLSVLTNYGYNPHTGTILCGEMGTANISQEFREALERVTECPVRKIPLIRWEHSGRFGEPFKGMIYEGSMTGNFRFKAPLESWFNLWRNHMAALPGNTGRTTDLAPEESFGLLRESTWFLRQIEKLPLERRFLLSSPVLEWGQFNAIANELVEIINRRTDHTLGQWEKLGFTQPVILDTIAANSADPAATERILANPAALAALTAADPRLRRLSPREVWQRHAPGLRRLSPAQLVQLMPREAARRVRVNDRRDIVIDAREIDSEPLHFTATHCLTPQGRDLSLRPGDEFLAFLNPHAPGTLYLCEDNGAFLGTLAHRPSVSRADHDALMRQYGHIRAAAAPVLADIAARAEPLSNRRIADRAANRRAADRSPLLPAEHAAQAARDTHTAAFERDHLPEPAPAPEECYSPFYQ